MARSASPVKGKEESVSGYFRNLFREEPELLDQSDNVELVARWLADHPGFRGATDKIKANLANMKGIMRRERRMGGGKVGAKVGGRQFQERWLEILEESIDECLAHAKRVDREGLDDVIRLLRNARNGVVWLMGEPA